MRYIAIALLLTGCGDYAAPVPDDVIDVDAGEVLECVVDDDCTDSGRIDGRYCQDCVCVSVRPDRSRPCWKLGGYE
jgi:hypothetical protein